MTCICSQRLYRPAIIGLFFLLLFSCKPEIIKREPDISRLVIFNINDAHAQINNFDKVKQIVTQADIEENGNVIVVSGGDNFSGNPVVDYYSEKGFPFIDMMNECGFDVAVLGNHEYDYGQENLRDRIIQSDFPWICSNVDMGTTVVPEPQHYVTIETNDIRTTFVGFVQTSVSSGKLIPATHPFRVEGITFYNAFDFMWNYSTVSDKENSDMVVALSHMGTGSDYNIAANYPFFDLIIGGHSHQLVDTLIGTTQVVQAGGYLHWLGKTTVTFEDKTISDIDYELINLDDYPQYDSEIRTKIEDYNNRPELYEVIGYNDNYLSKSTGLGCFYTDVLRAGLGTDISFQNSGGLRSSINEGEITVYEIYSMDPFSNGARTYTMTVGEIKDFLIGSGAGFYYSGIDIEDGSGGDIVIRDMAGSPLANNRILTVGINDYIPALYPGYFPDNPLISQYTTAEVIIDWLRNSTQPVNYQGCNHYYRY